MVRLVLLCRYRRFEERTIDMVSLNYPEDVVDVHSS